MYKSGGGIEVDAESFRYQFLDLGNGLRASDHASAECELTFTITDDFKGDTGVIDYSKDERNTMFSDLAGFIKILILLLSNLDQVMALL